MAQSVDFLVCARTVRESFNSLKTFVFFCPFLCNFKPGAKMLLPKRYVTVKFTLKNGNLEKWSYLLVIDLLYLQLADAGWLQNIPEPTDHWWPAGDMDPVTLGAVVFLGTLSAQLETNFHKDWSETFGGCLGLGPFLGWKCLLLGLKNLC